MILWWVLLTHLINWWVQNARCPLSAVKWHIICPQTTVTLILDTTSVVEVCPVWFWSLCAGLLTMCIVSYLPFILIWPCIRVHNSPFVIFSLRCLCSGYQFPCLFVFLRLNIFLSILLYTFLPHWISSYNRSGQAVKFLMVVKLKQSQGLGQLTRQNMS